jgi:hypothetical protein
MSVKRRSKLLFAYFCFITGLSSAVTSLAKIPRFNSRRGLEFGNP